jgi:hypothetical protein
MDKSKLIESFTDKNGITYNRYKASKTISKSDFYKMLAKIHYDHIQFLKQKEAQ